MLAFPKNNWFLDLQENSMALKVAKGFLALDTIKNILATVKKKLFYFTFINVVGFFPRLRNLGKDIRTPMYILYHPDIFQKILSRLNALLSFSFYFNCCP